jgi:predicted double-glycine peptidase
MSFLRLVWVWRYSPRDTAPLMAQALHRLALSAFLISLFCSLPFISASARAGIPLNPAANPESAPKNSNPALRRAFACGPNCLYMLLALHDVSIDNRAVEEYISLYPRGMSLFDLKEASAALGLRTEVRRCSIEDLRRNFQSPVIAYLVDGIRKHYVILVNISADAATILDGTTGEIDAVKIQWLNRSWSGYVLMHEPGFSAPWYVLAVCLAGCLLLICLALKLYRSRSPHLPRERVMGLSRCSIIIILICTAWVLSRQAPVAAGPPPTEEQGRNLLDRLAYYRTPENDAVNCLYVQLRLLGYAETYQAFCERLSVETQPFSLASLASQSRALGFPLVPVKMTISELAQVRAPAIVHFEEIGVSKGNFHLFLGAAEDGTSCLLIHGTHVTREWMPRDRFRRGWTGYALVPRSPFAWGLWARRITAGLIVMGLGTWFAGRMKSSLVAAARNIIMTLPTLKMGIRVR